MMLGEDAQRLLERLVAIPSLSGFEEEVCGFVADYVEGLGLRVEKQEVYKTGYNVVARLGKGDDVLFCGHLDVVPEFDMIDAFKPRIIDGKLYGRGACDMKGGVTSMLLLLQHVRRIEPEPDLSFAFVVDEEMHGRGAAELMRSGTRAEVCIITEPTNNVICVGNASCIEFRLSFLGRSGHGASRTDGNAVKMMMRFYEIFEERLFKTLGKSEQPLAMTPIINIGRVEGGYGPWIIPPKASCDILVHMHPLISYETGVRTVRKLIEEVSAELGIPAELTLLHGCDGFLLPRDNRHVELLEKAYAEVLNKPAEIGLIEAETDGNALFHKGKQPCIIYGPGDIIYAHSSQEHVAIADVLENFKVLNRFVQKMTEDVE